MKNTNSNNSGNNSEFAVIKKNVENCFRGIVGMKEIVSLMIEGVLSLHNGGEGFSGTLVGQAGKGKSALLAAYGKALECIGYLVLIVTPSEFRKDGDERFAEIKNMICERGKEYALFIDEAHELFQGGATQQLKKVAVLAMKGLDGNFMGGPITLGDNLVAHFNRRNAVIMLATNYPARLPDALCGDEGRTARIILPDYDTKELSQILAILLKRFNLTCDDKKALKRIVDCARGTARPLEKIVRQMSISLSAGEKARTKITAEGVTDALRKLQMFPRGLNVVEMQMLERLSANPVPDRIIQQMFPGSDAGTLRKSRAYLMLCGTELDKNGKPGMPFVAPVTGGSMTTEKGKRFLADCKAAGFAI